jgi:hypothetical protein
VRKKLMIVVTQIIITPLLVLSPFAPRAARAQDSSLVVGTIVAAAGGAPLSYATYSISPGGIRRFTGADGVFGVRLPARRSYHLTVRQLGYTQLDTVIVTGGSAGPLRLRLGLVAVPHRLAAVRATARRACSTGGAVAGSSDLAVALEAVRINAEREVLLRWTYPFTYRLARTTRADGPDAWKSSGDTADFVSSALDPYQRGAVVRERPSASGGIREMRIPQLTDLANDTFLDNHCFSYGGLQKVDGATVYEIDFDPLADIATPDVRGSIMLDTATFQIHRAEFQLTRGEFLVPPVAGLYVTTSYRDVFRGVSLFNEIKSVQAFVSTGAVENRRHQTETQRLLGIHFIQSSPGDVSPLVAALAAESARVALADSVEAATVVAAARARAAADSVALKVASAPAHTILAGTVVDSLDRPLAGAELRRRNELFLARTDALGRFSIDGLQDTTIILVRSGGYAPAAFSVVLPPGKTHRVKIVLTPEGVTLAPVVVEGVSAEAPRDFLARRAHGQGTYFTSEDIAKAKPRKISDMLRRVTGLKIQMKGEIYGNRGFSSINDYTNACMHGMAIFIDNTHIGGGDMGDPTSTTGDQTRTHAEYVGPASDLRSQLDAINPDDVAAIEVYPGPATVPASLQGAATACGAVYIWTKGSR